MGGDETLRKLVELDPLVKAVVSSGYADNNSIADHLAHGFCASLNKPYRVEELGSVVDANLGS